jgi:hypothetical protein
MCSVATLSSLDAAFDDSGGWGDSTGGEETADSGGATGCGEAAGCDDAHATIASVGIKMKRVMGPSNTRDYVLAASQTVTTDEPACLRGRAKFRNSGRGRTALSCKARALTFRIGILKEYSKYTQNILKPYLYDTLRIPFQH